LDLLNYLKGLLSPDAAKRQSGVGVREEPVLYANSASPTSTVRFPPFEMDDEEEIHVAFEGSGDALRPTLRVSRISGDPSLAVTKRFLNQLATLIKERVKPKQ